MESLRITLIGIFLIFAPSIYAQTETENVIQTVIDLDKDLIKNEIIVYEYLENYNDTSWINSITDKYGVLNAEEINSIQFGNLNVKLISKSALRELNKISSKLNNLTKDDDENFSMTKYQLVNDIFDKDLCVFYKVLFTKDKKYALIKYSVITGNSLGRGDFSSTYLMEQKNGNWLIKEHLESEI